MTQLLLVRHGETDWNSARRWQGHTDTPLNDVGRAQARALAAGLPPVDAVYASDLARARETAEILVVGTGVDVRLDARLRERGFGAWEGLTMDEIAEQFADDHAAWLAGTGNGAADAEPVAEFAARVGAFVDDVAAAHGEDTVLVVAHGGTLRCVYAIAAGLDYVRDHDSIPGVPNCTLVRYAIREGKLAPVD